MEAQRATKREIAGWLMARRHEIEAVMAQRLGPVAPAASSPESEALRRFRSFSAATLHSGFKHSPSLEGLRPNERRMRVLLDAWTEAAAAVAGQQGSRVRDALSPLADDFRLSLRSTGKSRRARGAPRASRRAVVAAIDRIADAFFAVDTDDARIADANPAAGALLGVQRDALLEVDIMRFVPEAERTLWLTQLDAIAEGDEPRSFGTQLMDRAAEPFRVDASATRFATKGRTLALVLARRG